MIDKMFNPKHEFWQAFSKITDILILSLMWILCCIPIITIGASSTALYDATVKCVRHDETPVYKRFLTVFAKNFKASLLPMMVFIPVGIVLLLCLDYLDQGAAEGLVVSRIYLSLYLVMMIVPVGTAVWCFSSLSRFEFPEKNTLAMALRLCLGHFLHTVAIAVLTMLSIWIVTQNFLFIFFIPCVVSLVQSIFIEKVFLKYSLPKVPEATVADH